MTNLENIQKIYSLSNMQSGILYHVLLDKESQAYFEQEIFTLKGKIDPDIFQESFNSLIKRYDILRTNFVYENLKNLKQVVLKERLSSVDFKDISSYSDNEKKIFIESYKKTDRETGFDLTKDILIRISLLKTEKEEYKAVWSFHHILMDGWCIGILLKEFMQIYQSLKENKQLTLDKVLPYSDYITWLEKQDKEEAKTYWKNFLEGYDKKAEIPKTVFIKKEGYFQKNTNFIFNKEQTDKIKYLARNAKVTVNTIFQCIWGILLQKYNDNEDVVFGSVLSGRPSELPGVEKMVGLFINTIPVRIKCYPDESFVNILKRVQDVWFDSEKYSYISLAEIQAESILKQDLIDHILVYENFPIENEVSSIKNEIDLEIDNLEVFEQTNYDLNVILVLNEELKVNFNYNSLKYDEKVIEDLGIHINHIAGVVIENPDIKISEIEIMSEEDRKKILFELNDTNADYSNDKTIYQLFEEQVEKNPDNIALVFDDNQITYKELNEKSNQLARIIIDKGVNENDNVALVVGRNINMIVGMLAILKSGCAYVPIDSDYPLSRMEYIIKNSNVKALLTEKKCEINHNRIIMIDHLEMDQYTKENLNLKKSSGDLAYIIYTSGSTGEPKGVMIEHHSTVNLISWVNNKFNICYEDSLLFITSMCFDLSVYDIFGMLAAGGRIIITGKEQVQNPEDLKKILINQRITFWDSVPSTMNYLINYLDENNDSFVQFDLRLIFMSGDWIPVKLPERLKKYFPNAKVISLGGATECTVWSNYYQINHVDKDQSSIPYGKPINNSYFYILDRNLNIVPKGVTGELFIGGAGVARGYINDKMKTDFSFINNIFLNKPYEMMYRTGDLGRMLPEGNIEFLGRKDHQVKIRGYRVELGEIENKILTYKYIKEAVVIAKEDLNNNKYLCGFIVSEKEDIESELREYLSKILPEYMIPLYFVRIEKLPLTSNGKIDRKALPEPDENTDNGVEYTAPRNQIEEQLVIMWQELLGIKKIGINDDFFKLGGHSLKIISLKMKISKQFGIDFPLQQILNLSTIKGISESIQRLSKKSLDEPILLLNNKKTKNIFAFPPAVAFGSCYRETAKLFKNYSFYSFDFIEDESRLSEYVKYIISIQPDGPYILFAFSSGGNLAFEVAQELMRQGYKVSDLIFIDAVMIGKVFYDKNSEKMQEVINVTSQMINKFKKDNKFTFNNDSIEKKIGKYMSYSQKVNISGKINSNIHFILSEEYEEKIMVFKEKWADYTTKEFKKYQGYGIHEEMLYPDFVRNNIKIVNNILNNISGN
jgi:amino acid adenylation domain-containing protein